ncbi:MAG: hypothetical protein HYV09_12815 [Deltaproteobacteria bacterium]|nr:hypothetical protein [Deltaproteobacteria bacterium]
MRPSLTLTACIVLTTSMAAAQTEPEEAAATTDTEEGEAAPAPSATPPSAATALPPMDLEPPPVSPKPVRTWYGWQNLAIDGAAVTLLYVAGNASGRDNDSFGYGAVATYALGGPIIHLAHGNPGTALGSLALRVGAPVGGAMLGCAADADSSELGCLGGAVVGFLLGYGTAVAVDAAALAYEEHEAPRAWSKTRPLVTPTASWTGHAGSIGLQGLF